MIHAEVHPLAGHAVTIKDDVTDPARDQVTAGATFLVEDWFDRVNDTPWGDSNGNLVAIHYAWRAGLRGLPGDNEVIFGKINSQYHLVHASEIEEN